MKESTKDVQISLELEDGTAAVISYYDNSHTYWLRGGDYTEDTKVPSATAVAKKADPPFLGNWVNKLAREAFTVQFPQDDEGRARISEEEFAWCLAAADRSRDESAAYGKDVHEVFEDVVSGHKGPFRRYRREAEAFARWVDDWQIRPLVQEQVVAHFPLGFAGTLDLLAEFRAPGSSEDKVGLFDLKSGGVWPSAWAQLGGYRLALRWLGWTDAPSPDETWIVNLRKGDKLARVVPEPCDPDQSEAAFECALFCHGWAAGVRKEGRGWR